MYALKKEINDLEEKFKELELAIGTNWLSYDDKIREFFAIWQKITQHYQYSSDTFIHPLIIYIYKIRTFASKGFQEQEYEGHVVLP